MCQAWIPDEVPKVKDVVPAGFTVVVLAALLIPMIDASHYNIRDPRFKKVDPYALQFDNPFKEDVFLKTTYGNIKPDKKWVTSKI